MTKKHLLSATCVTFLCGFASHAIAQESLPAPLPAPVPIPGAAPAAPAPGTATNTPAASADPAVETPTPAAPTAPAAPAAEESFSVMTVESFLKRAAVKYKTRERAKAGGILLEAAEWLEGMGGIDQEVLAAEVAALQQAALTTARGEYPEKLLTTLALNSTIRLALVEHRRSHQQWGLGNLRVAGSAWRNSLAHLEKTIALMGFGLKDAGADTMVASKALATSMSRGEPVDPDDARQQANLTGKMIHEVGRNLATQSDQQWNFKATTAAAPKPERRLASRTVPPPPESKPVPRVPTLEKPAEPAKDTRQQKGAELQKAIEGLRELDR